LNKWQYQAPLVILDEFLVAQEWAGLLRHALKRGTAFNADGGGEYDTGNGSRPPRVLHDLGRFHAMFADRIMAFLPQVLARLRQPPFPVTHIEIQMTATNDGQFLPKRRDNDIDRCRSVAFVYYFFREPKSFTGGALRLYDAQLDPRGGVTGGSFQTIHPMQNQIVVFPSDCLQEVLPVSCQSRQFANSRFTVNGWLHQ